MSTSVPTWVRIKRVLLCRMEKIEAELHKCTLPSTGSNSFLPPIMPYTSFIAKLTRSFRKNTLISEYNPQSYEYFRSKAEILRVREDHVKSNSWIIHPFSKFRAYYEMWMTLIWLLVLFYMPAQAAFNFFDKSEQSLLSEYYQRINYVDYIGFCLRIICLLDILVTFFTGYPVKKKRKVVMKPLKIVKNYVFSIYFITDLLASLPLDVTIESYVAQRSIDCLGFLRIIRLPTLYFYVTRTLQIFGINHSASISVKHIIVHYLVFHWFACIQYIIPQIRFLMNDEIIAESWMERTDLPELDLHSRYLICLYRAIGTLFCITFEEGAIEAWEEKLVAILSFIFGKVYLFYLTVLILNYLLAQRSLETKYFETISQVQAYMSQKQLPISMQHRLLQFYDYKYNKKFFKERGITSLLSEKLKGEINLSICSKLVQNVKLLSHLPQTLLEQVVLNLKPEIYLANDIIIKAGSVGDCMYFLASGTVGVWTPSGKEVCHLQDGAYFGEISLVFKDKRRTANIVAVEICEVYKLDRRVFKNCFKTNSNLFKMLEEVAKERMLVTQTFEDVHAKSFMETHSRLYQPTS